MNSANSWDEITDLIDNTIEDQRKSAQGAQRFGKARKEWNNTIQNEQVDIPVETLLTDDYFLGRFNIWPSIIDELSAIWHYRCDFEVDFYRGKKKLASKSIYALSFEHAKRRASEKWKRIANDSDNIHVWRKHNIHTVVIECPKGTGKDFEMSLAIWLLVREYLIQDRTEFFAPYNLDLDTTVSINCMNRSQDQAKRVTFKELLPKFRTPFFEDYFPPQVDLDEAQDKRQYPSELRFPRNVVIFPGSGTAATGLGYCIGASCIDEANFMERTASSKRTIMGAENYDAAQEAYDDLYQRQESRFGAVRNGVMTLAGLTIVISSSRTKNDFTQTMKKRAQNDSGIYYTSKAFWERKPLDLSGETFQFDVDNMRVHDLVDTRDRYDSLIQGLEQPEAMQA
tara:strand:+ start:6020 stop:7210 length:1191 start_codon:yes stop_codon:yes gene_type:complete